MYGSILFKYMAIGVLFDFFIVTIEEHLHIC